MISGSLRQLQRCADLLQMVPAVSQRVIFDEKLRCQRSVRVQRDRCGAVELFVRERADRFRGGTAVSAEQIDRLLFADCPVLLCMRGVDIRYPGPRHSDDWM